MNNSFVSKDAVEVAVVDRKVPISSRLQLLLACLHPGNSLLRAGTDAGAGTGACEIRLVGTTCNKSDEVVNLVTRC